MAQLLPPHNQPLNHHHSLPVQHSHQEHITTTKLSSSLCCSLRHRDQETCPQITEFHGEATPHGSNPPPHIDLTGGWYDDMFRFFGILSIKDLAKSLEPETWENFVYIISYQLMHNAIYTVYQENSQVPSENSPREFRFYFKIPLILHVPGEFSPRVRRYLALCITWCQLYNI